MCESACNVYACAHCTAARREPREEAAHRVPALVQRGRRRPQEGCKCCPYAALFFLLRIGVYHCFMDISVFCVLVLSCETAVSVAALSNVALAQAKCLSFADHCVVDDMPFHCTCASVCRAFACGYAFCFCSCLRIVCVRLRVCCAILVTCFDTLIARRTRPWRTRIW